ncbi:MAG: hypothetical protein IT210_20310 [Armatimonadetes bacterium]|nr:hypothetical protein [Armatimonadota bacterium]
MKTLIYNDDGWSSYMRYPAPMSPEDIVRATVGPVAGTGVQIYQFGSLGGHAVQYRSSFLPRVGDRMDRIDTMHVWRIRETLRSLDEQGTDPLRIVASACHRENMACQFSLRMNDAHHTYRRPDGSWYFPELLSGWLDAHPEALLPSGQLDYAHPDVHDYRLAQIREILDGYEVDGIDLDFTRFRPFFRAGAEDAGRHRMTELLCRLRDMTRASRRTLSARFEYDPRICLASGLAVDRWLANGLLDQVTLGGVGDHTPDAPADWWIEQARRSGCKVFPGIEGQLHWLVASGGGGTGLRPGNGVEDGFGPPSLPYLRAVAAAHYRNGADGVSLFNFTCADGPIARQSFIELSHPEAVFLGDKQYVMAVWPWDAQIFGSPWKSRFRVAPGEPSASCPLRVADDFDAALARNRMPAALLILDLAGVNRLDDIDVCINGASLAWNGYHYNHYDHGCWNDIVQFHVPARSLRAGDNDIELVRLRENEGFDGDIEVRKCILDLNYPPAFQPGSLKLADG